MKLPKPEFKDQLFLTRKDLHFRSRDEKLENIDIDNFRLPKEVFFRCSYAEIQDNDGTIKVLKSRYGNEVRGKTVRLAKTCDLTVGQTISAKDLLAML